MKLIFTIKEDPDSPGKLGIDAEQGQPEPNEDAPTKAELNMAHNIAALVGGWLTSIAQKDPPPTLDINPEPAADDPGDPGCEIIPLPTQESKIIIP